MTNPAQATQAAKAKKKVPQTFLGISISSHKVEVASIQPSRDVETTPHKIIKSVSYTLADGILSFGGDVVQDPNALGQIISSLVDQVKPKSRVAHLSIPGTLLRFTEMPKMQPKELYLSLSSEAERYKIFDDTEAAVDFSVLDIPGTPANQQKLVFGAVRNDTLNAYKQILKIAKIKIASIDLEPLNVLRGMAGTAVLNSLVQQIGPTAFWGTILVEPERVRLLLWQGSNLVDLREFQMGDPNSYVISDLLDEIQRTTKTNQPAIWLTYRMPEVADKILSERLNIPVRSCLIGPAITQDQPDLMVSTVGTALRSLVSFPFDFDILTSSKLYAAPTNKPDNSKNKEMLVTLGIFG
ncbi:MAG: pilus assembly protein PilM, partial [Cyanobacteria bacterium]|nr:pilus assembly protein PilM [Cyanobacteriota bacterium]